MDMIDQGNEVFASLDQLVLRRAETHKHQALLSYPQHEEDFVDYTGHDIELLTRIAALRYADELAADGSTSVASAKVALVGVSSVAYYLTFIAAQRLGASVVLISPRLADQGIRHLLDITKCTAVIASEAMRQVVERAVRTLGLPVRVVSMIDSETLAGSAATTADCHFLPGVNKHRQQQIVIHSGGTTGLPKPVPIDPATWLGQTAALAERIPKVDTLTTLPLFHSFGLWTLFRCLHNGNKLSILNANRPITAPIVTSALDATASKALITVPYILKFFGEAEGGTERLAALRQVTAAGSAIPDDLGDRLVAAGVNIFHLYGLTETGALMEPSKDQWNWVTPLPHAGPFLKFEQFEDDLYHLVVLPGLKAKAYSDRPDGSYATKDLFWRHPKDPRKWKFAARKDDIIVLVNGEKADPTPLEAAMMRNTNVKAAVVFGAQRQSLGMIVVRSDQADGMNDREFIDTIQGDLEVGNMRVPAFARVDADSIIAKPSSTPFARTDKATVARMQVLKQFSKDIDDFYAQQEESQLSVKHQSAGDLRELVRKTIQQSLHIDAAEPSFTDFSDFFDLGMDSLQAAQVRSKLVRELGLRLTTNVVFDHPTVELLVNHLSSSHVADRRNGESEGRIARELVAKYSQFSNARRGEFVPHPKRVLLTGATGTIGVHLLYKLLQDDQVKAVYCLVRATTVEAARARIVDALKRARLSEALSPTSELAKMHAQPCDFSEDNLGLTQAFLDQTRSCVTHIIHNAWSVNFNRSMRSFEQQCIRPTHFLLDLANQSCLKTKPAFTFVSSIAVAIRHQDSDFVPENLVPWSSVGHTGYAQSKWIAEQIAATAAETCHIPVRIARVGQVCGDTKHGIWNPSEAIPLTIQAALTIGALPLIEKGDEKLSWLPVDLAAKALVEVAKLDGDQAADLQIFHVVNIQTLLWNAQFLPCLREHGLEFEAVPQSEWLRRLESSTRDAKVNPPVKLLEHFRGKYGPPESSAGKKSDFALESTAKSVPAVEEGWKIDNELVGRFLKYWMMQAWSMPSSRDLRDSGVNL